MNNFIDTLSALGTASFSWLWMPLLAWTALALVFFGALRLVRGRTHPLLQYQARAVLLLALPLGIGLALFVSQTLALIPMSRAFTVTEVVDAFQEQAGNHLPAIVLAPRAASTPVAPFSIAFWMGLATLLAAGGALWRLGRLAYEALLLRRFKAQLRFVDSRGIEQRAGLAPGTAGFRSTRVRYAVVGDAATVPMTFGWWRPVVVVPAWLLERKHDLRLVLLHELVHVRRHDYPRQWIERVVDALFAVNPLVRYLIKQLDRYRELACDAEVLVRARVEAHAYASLLYRILLLDQPTPAYLTPNIAPTPSNIKTRISTMEQQTHSTRRLTKARQTSLILCTFLLLLGTSLVACSEFITEADAQSELPDARASDVSNPLHILRQLQKGQADAQDLNLEMNFWKPSFQVNTERISHGGGGGGSLQGFIAYSLPSHGRFIFSGVPFDGAERIAHVQGKVLRVETSALKLVVTSADPILRDGDQTLWFRHDPASAWEARPRGIHVRVADHIRFLPSVLNKP